MPKDPLEAYPTAIRYGSGLAVVSQAFICIPEKQVSRKHLIIDIAPLPQGEATNVKSRAKVTLEDLDTKFPTIVNAKNIKGEHFELLKDDNAIKLGKASSFRITWHPVVFRFQFTKTEMQQQADPVAKVRSALEPLDIKFLANTTRVAAETTHVVSKKKNHPRVLEALINCQLVVNQAYIDAILHAAVPYTDDTGVETSPLEKDFGGNWPDAAKYLPIGAEWDDAAFAPDHRRRDLFDGYTFIFYDETDHADLLPAITSGKGKALFRKVVPGQTEVDDFIRYIKSIAGEKGLGELEDGSEGRGVAVVRNVPKDGNEQWYLDFFNEFALRLDHRPIGKGEFLSAVLAVDATQLRKSLQLEPTPRELATQHQNLTITNVATENTVLDIDQAPPGPVVQDSPSPSPSPPPIVKPRKGRSQAKSKFKSFDIPLDSDDDDEAAPTKAPQQNAESQGIFMTQSSDVAMSQASATSASLSLRKRPAPESEREPMDSVAPTAARFKRMRLETGESPLPAVERTPLPESEPAAPAPVQRGRAAAVTIKKPARKGKKAAAEDAGDELLDQLVQTGQEEQANRRAEDDLLRRQLFEGEIDFGEIRQATAVETVAIRRRPPQVVEEGGQAARWNPHWNGLKNYKKFRSRTDQTVEVRVRAPLRKILPLEPVHPKESGPSDDYWLDNTKNRKGRTDHSRTPISQHQTQRQDWVSQQALAASHSWQLQRAAARGTNHGNEDEGQEEEEEEEESEEEEAWLPDVMDAEPPPPYTLAPRSRKGMAADNASQHHVPPYQKAAPRTKKRLAVEPPAAATSNPAKRSRTAARAREEDSEDEVVGFRFGKRK